MSSSQNDNPLISVVAPIYNEERNVVPLVQRLSEVFDKLRLDWELVFALDPCADRTEEKIRGNDSGKFSYTIGKILTALWKTRFTDGRTPSLPRGRHNSD